MAYGNQDTTKITDTQSQDLQKFYISRTFETNQAQPWENIDPLPPVTQGQGFPIGITTS